MCLDRKNVLQCVMDLLIFHDITLIYYILFINITEMIYISSPIVTLSVVTCTIEMLVLVCNLCGTPGVI